MEPIPVLITGGCGFLGTRIISALLSTQRFTITAIDINPPSPSTPFPTSPSLRYVRANVLDPSSLLPVFEEAAPTIVVHTVGVYPLGAARYSMRGADAVYKVNVEGTRNVLEISKKVGTRGVVYTSSVTVVFDEAGVECRNVDERWPTGMYNSWKGDKN